MSDGGKENGRDSQQQKTRNPSSGEDFVRAIAKIAVAQICENEGFHSSQQSALEAFVDVAVRYIEEIGKTANLYANVAGRSECNALDVIQGLEDLGSIQGFSGASDVNHSLSISGILREIVHYRTMVGKIPFAYELPRFPDFRERKPPNSFIGAGKAPPGEHIPAWLPVFPILESNSNFPTCNGGEIVGDIDRIGRGNIMQERRDMHWKLAAKNGSEVILCPFDALKPKKNAGINPFLAPPLLHGEKEVSSIGSPRFLGGACLGYQCTPMEGFGPDIAASEAEEATKFSESEGVNRSIELDGRPAVRFKLCNKRKFYVHPRIQLLGIGDEGFVGCFGTKDGEKHERKRIAEQLLKESMENSSGRAQL